MIPAKDDGGWAGGLEGREITAMSESAATKAFSTAKPSLRLGLALRVLRVRRSVTISCAEPTVLALAGVAKSVFADGANECLTSLSQELDRSPAIHELDSEARAYAGRKATAALMDEAEEWLLQGAWIPEFCRVERRPAGPVGPQTAGCTAFLGKATNLARILNERLAKAGELFSENEMAPVFAYLEKPACPC